ncbi:MAG: TRAP transporter fused permease subunit [Chloroflexota bacterium]
MSTTSSGSKPMEMERQRGLSRYHFMPLPIKVIFIAGPIVSVTMFILHYFSIPVFGQLLASTLYYYALFASLAFNVFVGLAATPKDRLRPPPWYDYVLAFLFMGCMLYFLANSAEIGARNWDVPPGPVQVVVATVAGALSIEGCRRVGGWSFVGVLIVAIIYPMVASNLPGVLYGTSFTFDEVMGQFAYGAGGLLGLPARMFGSLILGFYLFAGMVNGMGGGPFFLKLATGIAGRFRGGPAKVSVLASSFFGTLSGSVIANIVGTGSFTIPAMKKMGFSPEYAAAVEVCSSSGGDTMPPIMGGAIFLMVIIAGVDYADVMVAAFLPTFLHFFCLLIQVDSYSARNGIRGLPKAACPSIRRTLLEGWIFPVVIAFLVFGLVYMRWGAITPIYAIALTYILHFLKWSGRRVIIGVRGVKQPEMSLVPSAKRAGRDLETAFSQAAGLINFGAATFMGVAFILVGLVKTGLAAGLTTYVVGFGVENIYLILLICCLVSVIMGTAGMERSAYLFLAVTIAPGLVALGQAAPELAVTGGISIIAVHLFLIWYIDVGGFSPPVAVDAYVAASLANANPVKTMWTACRLGITMILVPFFFILRPALLILGFGPLDVLLQLFLAMTGLWFLASGLEKYMIGAGAVNMPGRVLLIFGGFMFAFPMWNVMAIGAVICVAGFAYVWLLNHRRKVLAKETITR